ncbi:MAG: DUF4192 family protein [Rothia sp. (in: high G+C Gram-positive bacteria)]|nr:DUF4192 family protein [Rothia sp. (in: high G+C Gram-positive bacteria)]
MTQSNPFSLFDQDQQPDKPIQVITPVRTEVDVVAVCVHTLGFWPENSLVLLTVGDSGIGPLLRVDLADPRADTINSYLHHFLTQLPFNLPGPEPFTQMFALFFGPSISSASALKEEQAHTHQVVTDTELEFIQSLEPFLQPLEHITRELSINLLDAIAVGKHYIWALEPPYPELRRSQPITAVLTSALYQELLISGSTVASNQTEKLAQSAWNPLETGDPSERDHWLSYAELAAEEYLTQKAQTPAAEYAQILVELTMWDAALTRCSQIICHHASTQQEQSGLTLADRIRQELTKDGAAYLAASLNSTATLQLLIYLACTDLPAALAALESIAQSAEENHPGTTTNQPVLPQETTCTLYNLTPPAPQPSPAHDEQTAIEAMAATLSGRNPHTPNWQRLAALNAICLLLENITHGKPESLSILAQAWMYWLRGNSSAADLLLTSIKPEHHSYNPTLLHQILHRGLVPAWLTTTPTPPWQHLT